MNWLELGRYVNNARLDYYVTNIRNGIERKVTTHPINTRYYFGGGFIGDYTCLAVGSDNVFHAVWTDTHNVQTVTWWYGDEFVPTPVHQQDIVVGSGPPWPRRPRPGPWEGTSAPGCPRRAARAPWGTRAVRGSPH